MKTGTEDVTSKKVKRGRVMPYSETQKLTVIGDLLRESCSLEDIARRHGIGLTTLHRWLAEYEIESPEQIRQHIMTRNLGDLERENAELRQALNRSKLAHREKTIQLAIKGELLEILEKRHGIKVKKKDLITAVSRLSGVLKVDDNMVGVRELCRIAGISSSGFYRRRDQADTTANEELKASSVVHYVMEVRREMPQLGIRSLQSMVNRYYTGIFKVSRNYMYDLLRANGLLLKKKKRRRPPRTTYGMIIPGAVDLVNTVPKFVATDHCQLMVSDITYIKYRDTFLYLTMVMDAYSRVIVGYSIRRDMKVEGTLEALRQAVSTYERYGLDVRGCILHSDRGSQYRSEEMLEYEHSLGIRTSFTLTGDPLHNALAERLNGTIKNTFFDNYDELSFEERCQRIGRNIELYNTVRPHSALGMIPPIQMLEGLKQNHENKRYTTR